MLITSGGGTYIVSWGVVFEVLITSRGGIIFTVSYGSKGDLRLFWRGIFGMRGEGEQQPDISGGARLLGDDWTLIDISGGGSSSSSWCIRCVTSTGLDLNATYSPISYCIPYLI